MSPERALVGQPVDVTINGSGFGTGTPTINAGTGITISNVQLINSGEVRARFTIAMNAPPGNHAVSVTTSFGQSSTVLGNFFVQIPSKLFPFNHQLAPNGIGPLKTPVNGDVRTLEGHLLIQNFCGVYRSYLFFLADQEGQRIQAAFTFDEIFSNVNSPPGLAPPAYTPVNFPDNYVAVEDIQTIGFVGGCLNNNEFQTFTQKFKITVGGTAFFPTTTINIKRGNESGVLKVDRTITTQ